MSKENVETVKRAYSAINSGDIPTLLGLCHSDVELDNTNAAFDGTTYRGHDGIVEYFSLERDMWESQWLEPEEVLPVGDDQILVQQRIVRVGRDGIEVIAHSTTVYTMSEGKATRIKTFQTRADALAAVGPSTQEQ